MHKRFEELRYCGNLPSSPGVALQILRLTGRADAPAEDLLAVLRFDPVLSGKLLRLANSVQVGGTRPTCSLEQAAARLGAANVRSAALSFTLLPPGRGGASVAFDHELYWSYSIACALAAREIAAEEGAVDQHAAYTAGLLARLGLLALATIHAESFERLLQATMSEPPDRLLAEELRAFDIQHWEAAAAMFAEWGFCEGLSGAVLALGQPACDPSQPEPASEPLARCLRDAALVAQTLLAPVEPRSGLSPDWLGVMAPVRASRMERERLSSLCARVAGPWRRACEQLRLPHSDDGWAEPTSSPSPAPPAEPAAEPGAPQALAASQLSLLVVTGDTDTDRGLCEHLRGAGYRVRSAADGVAGLHSALRDPPHLVVARWSLPQLPGADLVRALRASEACRHAFVLVLSDRGEEQQVVAAFDAGADDVVAEPASARVLLARVQAGHRLVELQRQVDADRERRAAQAAELGLLTRKLHVAAHTDVLTGLPNRRYALLRLEQELADARQLGRPLSVLAIDVDRFKSVNDRCGHAVGDAVLRATASVLRARTRRPDIVCRLGGEEFLVINVQSTAAEAATCAERLRSAVAENVVRGPGYCERVTISLGLATLGDAILDVDDLLKAADEAVYAAKAAGRDAVRVARRCLPQSA